MKGIGAEVGICCKRFLAGRRDNISATVAKREKNLRSAINDKFGGIGLNLSWYCRVRRCKAMLFLLWLIRIDPPSRFIMHLRI